MVKIKKVKELYTNRYDWELRDENDFQMKCPYARNPNFICSSDCAWWWFKCKPWEKIETEDKEAMLNNRPVIKEVTDPRGMKFKHLVEKDGGSIYCPIRNQTCDSKCALWHFKCKIEERFEKA